MPVRTSPAARFQAMNTRAQMSAALWSRAIRFVLFIWIVVTIWLIWYRVGLYRPELHHEYFGRWILCGIINDTPLLNHFAPRLPMYADGAWYALPSFTQWLDGPEMYRDSFYSWYWHMATGLGGYYGLGTDLLPLGLGALLIGWRLRRDPDDPDHIRGLRLLSPRQHNRQLNGGGIYRSARRAFKPPQGGGSGIRLGTSIIPAEKEFEHFMVCGSPGSGKSTMIREILMQIQERGQVAIVLDVEGESTMEFYDESRGDVILNPLDARCPFWSPWVEFRDETLAMDREAMAASLIRDQPRTSTERFFFESGRTVVESLLQVITDRDPTAINEFLALPREEVHQALRGTRAYALVDPDTKETGQSIIATAINATKPFQHLPHSEEEAGRCWTAREWAQTRKGWVFLPSSAASQAAIQSLQGVWLDVLTRWLMSAEIRSDQVWIFADELPAIGYQPLVEQLVTRGRKRGIAVVLGFQNVSQLRKIYGQDGAITLTSSPTTKVILRVDEFETAQWASNLIGSHEVERLQMTQLAGLSNFREGVNLSPHRSIEHLVLPAEIQMLRPFHGYLCVAGEDRTTLRIPELHLTKRHEAFIPRVAATTPASEAVPEPEAEEPADAEILDQMTARSARPSLQPEE